MARGDHLTRIFASHAAGDEDAFRQAAQEVIAEERRKSHGLLADQLESSLNRRQPGRQKPLTVSSLRPLPTSRDETALFSIETPGTSLDDIVLRKRTRTLLEDIAREFRSASALHAHGIRPRNRLLLVGPPGTGKTMTAETLAGELGVPLLRVQVAAVVSSYLGETARNLSSIFEYCRQGSWVVLFDEFDALAKERADAAEHGELKRVVSAFLQLLDGFGGNSLILAASNHPALLDDAVWRRFDEVVGFDLPTQVEIAELIQLKLRSTRHKLKRRELARSMRGFSHAEVELICRDALRRAILDDRGVVDYDDVQQAMTRMEERRKVINNSRA